MKFNMPSILLRLVLALSFLYLLSMYFAWTDSPEVRYRKYYRVMYDMIYNETGDVSLIVMGSSRAQTMIGAFELQEEVFRGRSSDIVYNLATSQRGKGFHYVVIRDFFEHRQAAEVWLHFINTDVRKGYQVHPWFYIVAKNSDILESTLLRIDLPWHEKIIAGGGIFLKKHSSLIEDYLNGKLLLAKPKTIRLAKTRDHLSANPIRPNSIEVAMKNSLKDLISQGEEWSLSTNIEHRNNFYTEKIIELAQDNNSEIRFFYIPRLMEPTLSASNLDNIYDRFGVGTMAPDPADLTAIFPNAYADAGHGSNRGRKIYAKLLASKYKNLNREKKANSDAR